MRHGNRVSGLGMIASKCTADFGPPEIPPVIGVCQIGRIWIDRAQQRPKVVIGVLTTQRFQPAEKRSRPARALLRELECVLRSLCLEGLLGWLLFLLCLIVRFRVRRLFIRRVELPVLRLSFLLDAIFWLVALLRLVSSAFAFCRRLFQLHKLGQPYDWKCACFATKPCFLLRDFGLALAASPSLATIRPL